MAKPKSSIKIQADYGPADSDLPGSYRLVGPNGEEGGTADMGVPATLTIGNETYMAFLDQDGNPDEELGEKVYLLTEVEGELEEVSGLVEGEETEGEEEEGEEGEEGESTSSGEEEGDGNAEESEDSEDEDENEEDGEDEDDN